MSNRRDFIKIFALGSILLGKVKPIFADETEIEPVKGNGSKQLPSSINRILPPALYPGATIALVSPSSPVNEWNLAQTVKTLKKMGYKVEIGPIAKNQKNKHNYLAATDDERTAELIHYFQRNDIAGIMCARGGYGVMRILDKLEYEIIKNNPKVLIGFSDITALLNAIYAKTNLITFHGPVGVSKIDDFTLNSMNFVISNNKENFKIKLDEIKVINDGQCEGFIQGGNLRLITSTLGTPYEINTNDAILFLEDVSEHSYEIDRMLNQLILAGKMKNIRGIVFGKFRNLHVRKSFYPNRGKTIFEVIQEVCKPLGVPLVYDFPFGHTSSKITLPIGIRAKLDTSTKTFELLEPAVS